MKTTQEFVNHLVAQITDLKNEQQELKDFQDDSAVEQFRRAIKTDDFEMMKVLFQNENIMKAVKYDNNISTLEMLHESYVNVDSFFWLPEGEKARIYKNQVLVSPAGFSPDSRVFQIINE